MKHPCFKIIFIFFISISFFIAQTKKLDSLKSVLRVSKEDTNKLAILTHLIESINEDDVWVKYNDQLGPLAEKLMKSENSAISLNAKKHYADFLNNRGYINNNLGDVTSALDYFHKSIKIQEEVKDKIGLAYSFNNVGYIYNSQGDLIRALEFYRNSLKIREAIDDKQGVAQSLSNIGNLFEQTGDRSKALRYYYKGLRIREMINDKYGQSYSLQNIGSIYEDKNELANALKFFQQSLKLRQEIDDKQGIAYSLSNIGNIYFKQNQMELALENALASLKIANELGFPKNIAAASDLLQDIYRKQKKFEKAYEMIKLGYQMQDSIKNGDIQKKTLKKQFQYEFEKKEVIAKAEQEKKDLEYSDQINRNKIIISSVIICLLIVVLFSVFLYRRIKVIQNQNLIIENQKIEVDMQREIAINRSIIAEKQKAIIELHQKEMVDSITYAKRIQYALLANGNLIRSIFPDHFVYFKPKDIVSGDFYWATEHDNKFYLAVCDCTGHGVPGAFMSLLNINFLNEAVLEKNITQPNQIFNHVRNRLIENVSQDGGQDGMDAILLCMDLSSNTITYSAANNAPILIHDNKFIELPKDKMPVGKGEKTVSFTLFNLDLKKGDGLYLYTDGYADQFGGTQAKKFKNRNLNEYLAQICQLDHQSQLEELNNTYENWKGDLDQVDDICIIGIKF